MRSRAALREFARRMPKAELHVHLEGSIRPPTVLELARLNHVSLPVQDEDGLQALYNFRDFAQFIQTYVTITNCLRTPDDYRLIAYDYGREMARQKIRYAEVTFTIETNQRFSGLPWQTILEGLNSGRNQARSEFGVEMRWIFDIVRDLPDTQATVLEIALAARHRGCVALGLGGSEAPFPPRLFVNTFEQARQAGLPRVIHAGETGGPENVWDTLELLHADRLEHGVRSIEDPHLVEVLAQRQIALDVCPTSNIRLGVYPDYASHPLRQLWNAGVKITIGSDDPPMFGTDLNSEYQVLVDHFGFGADELEQVSLNGIHASLMPESDKQLLERQFKVEFTHLREELA
jgi:aminodeoxyfutalosine deaminase